MFSLQCNVFFISEGDSITNASDVRSTFGKGQLQLHVGYVQNQPFLKLRNKELKMAICKLVASLLFFRATDRMVIATVVRIIFRVLNIRFVYVHCISKPCSNIGKGHQARMQRGNLTHQRPLMFILGKHIMREIELVRFYSRL